MTAKFRLGTDLEIWLESSPTGNGAMTMTVYRGVCYEHRPGEECKEVEAQVLPLMKNEARAIASAMMGCAAEL